MIVNDEESVYHANPSLSSSRMKKLLACPAKYKLSFEQSEDSATFVLGRVTHAMILEPDKVQEKYMANGFDGRTKEGKAAAKKAKEQNIIVVPKDDWALAEGMASSVKQNPIWRYLTMEGLQPETSIYWDEMGIPCKARLDGIISINGQISILDVKTTKNASIEYLKSAIPKYGYHIQARWYKHALEYEGYDVYDFIFLFVENSAPFVCTAVRLSQEMYEEAEIQIDKALALYRECSARDIWPGYSDEIVTI